MIRYEEALDIVLAAAKALPSEACPLLRAAGRILAQPITSAESLPPFDNSAMDGFALRTSAGMPAGTELDVVGLQMAGDGRVTSETGAWEIMTGAPMPDGYDAVIPVEQVTILARDDSQRPRRIRLEADVWPGQHCRRRGEDVSAGQVVIPEGVQLQPQHLMLLASIGVESVPVMRRPRIAIIGTGQELVTDATQPLATGQIRDGNGPYLAARCAASGGELVLRETVDDDPANFEAAMARAIEAGADVVLSTGAVSMGVRDFVPAALRKFGAEILFHKVAIRPGKPLVFARLPDGRLYFGLPGNPVSSVVGWRFFVEPALRAMMNMPCERPVFLPLAHDYLKKASFRVHLKGRLVQGENGRIEARILPGQESFRIMPLVESDAWIVLPAEAEHVAQGDAVQVVSLGHLDGLRIDMARTT